MKTSFLSVRAMAAATGLSSHALRYYEKIGVLRPVHRATNGHRHYGTEDIAWIAFVLRLKHTGMPLAQIRAYAEWRAMGNSTIAPRLEVLEHHREHLIQRLTDLQTNLKAINAKITVYRRALPSTPTSPQPRKSHASQ